MNYRRLTQLERTATRWRTPQEPSTTNFWEAIRDADNALDAGDLEALISATERADSRSILRQRDRTECRKAANALRRLCDGLKQLADE